VFRAIKNDIAGWMPQLRDRNIDQLASVIAAMNTGQGPDLLGCARWRTASSSTDSSTG
jgi:hypothetical protein